MRGSGRVRMAVLENADDELHIPYLAISAAGDIHMVKFEVLL